MNSTEIFRRDHPDLWIWLQSQWSLGKIQESVSPSDWYNLALVTLAFRVLAGNPMIALRNDLTFQRWAIRWLAAAPTKLCQRCGAVADGSGIMCTQCWIETSC